MANHLLVQILTLIIEQWASLQDMSQLCEGISNHTCRDRSEQIMTSLGLTSKSERHRTRITWDRPTKSRLTCSEVILVTRSFHPTSSSFQIKAQWRQEWMSTVCNNSQTHSPIVAILACLMLQALDFLELAQSRQESLLMRQISQRCRLSSNNCESRHFVSSLWENRQRWICLLAKSPLEWTQLPHITRHLHSLQPSAKHYRILSNQKTNQWSRSLSIWLKWVSCRHLRLCRPKLRQLSAKFSTCRLLKGQIRWGEL